jgi:deferrochelatase/peroxidase EfeB
VDGHAETDKPDHAADPYGTVIPLSAHIRLSNPPTRPTADSRILRRASIYDRGVDIDGNLNIGLLFNGFSRTSSASSWRSRGG